MANHLCKYNLGQQMPTHVTESPSIVVFTSFQHYKRQREDATDIT